MSEYTRFPPIKGGGIASINGDTTPAQIIAAGTGIAVASSGGTTTISTSGVGAASWKAPVADIASLPSVGNTVGDARVVTDHNAIFIWGSDLAWHAETATVVWSPLISPAAKLMWESDTLVTNSSGSAVAWEDQISGETIVTSGTAPTIVANQLNGLPAIRFNGSTQALAGGVTSYLENSRAFSVYLVCKPAAFSGTQFFVALHLPVPNGNPANINACWLGISNATNDNDISWGNTSANSNINSGSLGLTSANFQVIRVFYNGQSPTTPANYTFTIGGTTHAGITMTGANEPASPPGVIGMGKRIGTNDLFYNGDIAAAYIFNTNNQANGVDALMTTYLMSKYGIS